MVKMGAVVRKPLPPWLWIPSLRNQLLLNTLSQSMGFTNKKVVQTRDLSPEEQGEKRQFEMKRECHFNEGLTIKFSGQIIFKDYMRRRKMRTVRDSCWRKHGDQDLLQRANCKTNHRAHRKDSLNSVIVRYKPCYYYTLLLVLNSSWLQYQNVYQLSYSLNS